jgi:SAM-dependent methyltransferase
LRNPLFTRLFVSQTPQRLVLEAPYRRKLLEGLAGQVLEVGCGSGVNFGLYPPEVTSVTAIEPDAYMYRQAVHASRGVLMPISLIRARAEDLGVRIDVGQDYAAVVFSLVLCSLDDPEAVLLHAKDLLAPGGQLRFFEHHLSDDATMAERQHKATRIWPTLFGGCRPDQDTLALISEHFGVTYSQDCWIKHHRADFFDVTAPHTVGYATPLA